MAKDFWTSSVKRAMKKGLLYDASTSMRTNVSGFSS